MIRKLYPQGKSKAFNISYDDGVLQDVRFVQLLNKYGMKGTFNLNSQLMQNQFEWVHENGMVVKRLSESVASGLYDGHEVASHTLTHPYMHALSEAQIMEQMTRDKANLEAIFGRGVYGFAVPFTYYSDLIAKCAQNAGFEYARISEESNSFRLPEHDYWWRAGKFHWDPDLDQFVDSFLVTNHELALCQIVGHSYDLDAWNIWGKMESILRRVSNAPDVLPMTNLELARYRKAMSGAKFTPREIMNQSAQSLWFRVNGEVIRLYPGETYAL